MKRLTIGAALTTALLHTSPANGCFLEDWKLSYAMDSSNALRYKVVGVTSCYSGSIAMDFYEVTGSFNSSPEIVTTRFIGTTSTVIENSRFSTFVDIYLRDRSNLKVTYVLKASYER